MNFNKVISAFTNQGVNSFRKEDLTDITKKNDAAVKTVKNIFDSNLDGNLDATELGYLEKLANLDGNNSEISLNDLKLFASMTGSASDISFGDLSALKSTKYTAVNNNISVYNSFQNKTSDTKINDDGSVTTTSYASDKTQTTIEYTSDYKMKSKTILRTNGSQEKYQYNDAGILIQKNEIAKDKSQTISSFDDKGKISFITKKDANNTFISKDEYDYDDNGKTASITSYNSDDKLTAKTIYNDEGTKIQVKYDDNEEIIQRDTFNKLSKPVTSFIKYSDNSTISDVYDYKANGDVVKTTKINAPDGELYSEEVSTTDLKGNQVISINGILAQKDEVADDGSIKSTVYSADNAIDYITVIDSNGAVSKIDYYSYVNGKVDSIIEMDAEGELIATGQYNYDNPEQIKSLDHFDASENLLDKTVWNFDQTKTVYKYNTAYNGIQGTLIETYGADNKIQSASINNNNGSQVNSTYTYNTPNAGDLTVNNIKINGNETTILVSIAHKDGTSEETTYNSDKTQILEKNTTDKYGNKVNTLYSNNQTTSVTKTNSTGTVMGKDLYNYANGILALVDHIGAYNKSTGTTQYDQSGNTKDFDSIGRIISSKTTNATSGAVTTESYQYASNGDKIVRTAVLLNGKQQSMKTTVTHLDNSIDISIYEGSYIRLTQKDSVSSDGKIKSAIYDQTTGKITRILNKNASGIVTLRDEYSYTANKTLDHIDCFNGNDALIQTTKYLSNGQKLITNYDANQNVKDITTYDKDGNVISVE